MNQLNPDHTTARDICLAALRDCGAWGVGQTPLAEDFSDAQARLQWMLQEWERKRWLVWVLRTYNVVCTGQTSYTIGPSGDFDTNASFGPYGEQFNPAFGPAYPVSVRPNQIESAFLRQLTQSQPNQIDYPMKVIRAREDYNRIALKELTSFPGYVYYESSWPLGLVYAWPIPQASIYGLYVSIKTQLPPMFATASQEFAIPYECYNAMVTNLAMRLRPKYGIMGGPGDNLPAMAKESLNVLKNSNFQIGTLQMPGDLVRPQLYNIFSDRAY